MRCHVIWLKWCGLVSVFMTFLGCTSWHSGPKPGIEPDYRAFVPGQVAILNCSLWPVHSDRVEKSVDLQDGVKVLCAAMNKFVVEGFTGQPYMMGFTPAAVKKLLQRHDSQFMDKWPQIWQRGIHPSHLDENPLNLYQQYIGSYVKWRIWLNQLSAWTRYSDAVLIPLIADIQQFMGNDRGQKIAVRSASVLWLMVDSNSGDLIWSGSHAAKMVTRQMFEDEQPGFPDWQKLSFRLLSSSIWAEYPGRVLDP